MWFSPKKKYRWRLWQVESSLACNLKCVMCPWEGFRRELQDHGHMSQAVWESLVPYLHEVKSIDFSGGGEPLLQKNLIKWLVQAKSAGCETGFLTNGMLLTSQKSNELIESNIDWIGFSIDGADQETYEKIRQGADFKKVCRQIQFLADRKAGHRPLILINFVIMASNFHQIELMIRLADRLGVDQLNFKQCDVIRGDHGKDLGLFGKKESEQIKERQKAIEKASKLAKKLGIKTASFSFLPEEQPVCDQDPRHSVFIRYDGSVAPCISLANGGPSTFLGNKAFFPTVHYGKLPDKSLNDLWQSKLCAQFRQTLNHRLRIHDKVLACSDYGHSLIKLEEAFKKAIDAMPEAPQGCRNCHYLFGV